MLVYFNLPCDIFCKSCWILTLSLVSPLAKLVVALNDLIRSLEGAICLYLVAPSRVLPAAVALC